MKVFFYKEEKFEKCKLVFISGVLVCLIVIVCIVWDLCMDWLIVSVGEKNEYFMFDFVSKDGLICFVNEEVFIVFGNDIKIRNVILGLCEMENILKMWKVLVVFFLIGFLFVII